jgi:hypothetical protein
MDIVAHENAQYLVELIKVARKKNETFIRLAGAEDTFSDFIGSLEGLVSQAEDADSPYQEIEA